MFYFRECVETHIRPAQYNFKNCPWVITPGPPLTGKERGGTRTAVGGTASSSQGGGMGTPESQLKRKRLKMLNNFVNTRNTPIIVMNH